MVTCSDSSGFVHDPNGINAEKHAFLLRLKNLTRGRISEYADAFPGAVFTPVDTALDHNPLWKVRAEGMGLDRAVKP